jgi:hypothetical protein
VSRRHSVLLEAVQHLHVPKVAAGAFGVVCSLSDFKGQVPSIEEIEDELNKARR